MTTTTFVGLAMAPSMFNENLVLSFEILTVNQVREILSQGYSSCCNPSHAASLTRLKEEFDLEVTIPEKAPFVELHTGDRVLAMSLKFDERKTEERTTTEVSTAKVSFKMITVIGLKSDFVVVKRADMQKVLDCANRGYLAPRNVFIDVADQAGIDF